MRENIVSKHIGELANKGLISAEYTSVITRNEIKRNGNSLYTILPIEEVIDCSIQRKLDELELATMWVLANSLSRIEPFPHLAGREKARPQRLRPQRGGMRKTAGGADCRNESGNQCRKRAAENESHGRLTEAMAHWDHPGEPAFSVCGVLCGQTQTAKFQAQGKVQKAKRNPPFSKENSGFCGTAIRT